MTLNVTRRQAIQAAVAGALARFLLNAAAPFETELVDVDEYSPQPYGDPSDWHPTTTARLAAAWELGAQQQKRPAKWRKLRYDKAVQWSDGRRGNDPLIIWFGIGPSSWTAERVARLLEWLEPEFVLAAERIARGRAFAIVSVGILSKRARAEQPRPAWSPRMEVSIEEQERGPDDRL